MLFPTSASKGCNKIEVLMKSNVTQVAQEPLYSTFFLISFRGEMPTISIV